MPGYLILCKRGRWNTISTARGPGGRLINQEHRAHTESTEDRVRREYKARRKLRGLYLQATFVSVASLALLYFLTGSRHGVLPLIGLGILGGGYVLETLNWRCPSCEQRLLGKFGNHTFCPHCHVRLGEPGRGTASTRQFLIVFLIMALATLAAFVLLQYAAPQ